MNERTEMARDLAALRTVVHLGLSGLLVTVWILGMALWVLAHR